MGYSTMKLNISKVKAEKARNTEEKALQMISEGREAFLDFARSSFPDLVSGEPQIVVVSDAVVYEALRECQGLSLDVLNMQTSQMSLFRPVNVLGLVIADTPLQAPVILCCYQASNGPRWAIGVAKEWIGSIAIFERLGDFPADSSCAENLVSVIEASCEVGRGTIDSFSQCVDNG